MDFELIARSMPKLLEGARMTLFLTAFAVAVGFPLALALALAKVSPNPAKRMSSSVLIYLFRGTPLIIQLYLIYYGLGQFRVELQALGLWWFLREPLYCALLVLTLNTACYSAEIFRGAIAGVPRGQIEAARATGMSWLTRTRRIVIPQALRIAWPAYTNEVVFIMQATSLVSLVTVTDIFQAADQVAVRSFKIYTMYLTAAAFYLVISYGIIFAFGLAERWLMRHRAPIRMPGSGPGAFAVLTR